MIGAMSRSEALDAAQARWPFADSWFSVDGSAGLSFRVGYKITGDKTRPTAVWTALGASFEEAVAADPMP